MSVFKSLPLLWTFIHRLFRVYREVIGMFLGIVLGITGIGWIVFGVPKIAELAPKGDNRESEYDAFIVVLFFWVLPILCGFFLLGLGMSLLPSPPPP